MGDVPSDVRFVVATDGSEAGERALDHAVDPAVYDTGGPCVRPAVRARGSP